MAGEAKVYILDIPYHADKAYSYYIPDIIGDYIVPGAVVEVPFGRGNRRMTGIVDEVLSADPPMSTKPITSAVSDAPVLTYEQLGLCRFVKEFTLCTFSDALRAIVPASAMARVITYYRCILQSERENPEIPSSVYSAIGERGKRVLAIAEKKTEIFASDNSV